MAERTGSLAARPLDRSSPLPLWAQLRDDLIRRVRAGAFEDGFPGELQLMDEYRVSRHTVRDAVRRLREAGLVDAGRGRPSVVRSVAIEQPLGSLYSLFRVVESQGMRQRSDVVAQGLVTEPAIARRLGIDDASELFHLSRVRYANEEPLACDRVWMPAEVARPLLAADFTHAALYDELASRCQIRLDGGSERITAVRPERSLRTRLGLPPDVACLAIERVGTLDRRPLEFRLTEIRGDRYAVTTEWSTSTGYQVGAAERSPEGSPT